MSESPLRDELSHHHLSLTTRQSRISIALFLAIAFIPAWMIQWLIIWLKPELRERDLYGLGKLAAMMLPALAAYIVIRHVERERDLSSAIGPRAPVRYYFLAILLVLSQWGIPAVIALVSGQARLLTVFQTTTVIYLLTRLVTGPLFGFGQEFGWRAFLFRRWLLRGPLFAFVVVGIVADVWQWGERIPLTMIAIRDRTEIATSLQLFSLAVESNLIVSLLSLPLSFCRSVIAGWLYLKSKDIWLSATWHGYHFGFKDAFDAVTLGLQDSNLPGTAISVTAIAIVFDIVSAILLVTVGKALSVKNPDYAVNQPVNS